MKPCLLHLGYLTIIVAKQDNRISNHMYDAKAWD